MIGAKPCRRPDTMPTDLPDSDPSTLWRYSAFERVGGTAADAGIAPSDGRSVLATTLVAELRQLQQRHRDGDVLEVFAACLRQRENALLLLRHRGMLWPVTVFPEKRLYHVKRDLLPALKEGNADLEIVGVEGASVRPPSVVPDDSTEDPSHYRPLPALLWALAVAAPHPFLLPEIAGRAAYRLTPDYRPERAAAAGALGPALRRLRTEISALRTIARWPGMDLERAMRLVNGVYLQGGLMVLRTHPAARDDVPQGSALGSWFRR